MASDSSVEIVELRNNYKMLSDLYSVKKAENEQLRQMNKILYDALIMKCKSERKSNDQS